MKKAGTALIAIVGPTASGKSDLAMTLAGELAGEIISCDSLQVYRGLDIGSAKPEAADRAAVPHHLLDVVDPDESFSAADFARLGRQALEEVLGRGHVPIVAGGTGLYLRALVEGLFEGPSRNPALRERLEGLANRYGDARLHRLLRRVDPEAAGRIQPRDRVRVVRALEVYWSTGRPLSAHQSAAKEQTALTGLRILTLGLNPGRARLRERVEERTDRMLARGLLDECRGLLAAGYRADLRPLRAIGYRQAIAVVEGRLGIETARTQIVTETMRYAKRQMTWFRHQTHPVWVEDASAARELATRWLRNEDAGS